MRPSILGLVAFVCALICAQASLAQPRDPEEPNPDVVASGKCEVPVCTDIDFGDRFFRYYAPGRAIRLKFIPKGSCQCKAIRSGNNDFNGSIVAAVTTFDGKVFPNVSVLRVQGEASRISDPTSWKHFDRVQDKIVAFPDFKWNDDDFSSFKIFADLQIYPVHRRQLYFVPIQRQFVFKGEKQPIVFRTALGYKFGDKDAEKDGPRVVAQVQLTDTVHLFEFFVPRLVPSKEWINVIEKVSEAVDTRLFRKSD